MARTKKEIEKLDIDKEEIVKELKKELKEQLLEEVTRKIDYESKKSLERVEKKILKHKNFSIFLRNIIILALLGIIIYESKILYDNNLLFKNDKVNTDILDEVSKQPIDKEDSTPSLDWYKEKYSYLIDNIKTNLEDTYYLYKSNYTIENLNDDIKLNMAYQLLTNEDKKIENSVISIENDKLKEAYLKIFKTLDNYKEVNFKDNCIQFVYNSSSNIYMAIDTTCSVNNDTLIRNIDDIYIKDDELVIELSVGILNNDKLSNIDGTIIGDYNNIEQLKDKLNKYTFVFEKSNDNYYIKEIKRK